MVDRGMYKVLLMEDKITGPYCVLLKAVHVAADIHVEGGLEPAALPDPFGLGEMNFYLLHGCLCFSLFGCLPELGRLPELGFVRGG